MMGAEEAGRVQDELAAAMGALTRAQAILYPHTNNERYENTEAGLTLRCVKKGIRNVEEATNTLDVE